MKKVALALVLVLSLFTSVNAKAISELSNTTFFYYEPVLMTDDEIVAYFGDNYDEIVTSILRSDNSSDIHVVTGSFRHFTITYRDGTIIIFEEQPMD